MGGAGREEQVGPGGSLTSSQCAVRILWAMISNYTFFLEAEEDTLVLEPKEWHFEKTPPPALLNQSYQVTPYSCASK